MLILILEIIGTIAFAISGAMTAINRKLDVLGVVIMGVTTACGGGLLRDIMLGITPQRLFVDPTYVLISFCVSLLMFIILYFLKNTKFTNTKAYKDILTLTDAIGLAVFVLVGAKVTIEHGQTSCFIVVFMSTLTAIGGGMLRDIMVNKIPNIFIKHIYAIPTILGAILFFIFNKYNVNEYISLPIIMVLIITIRMLAYKFELSLPKVELENEEIKNV